MRRAHGFSPRSYRACIYLNGMPRIASDAAFSSVVLHLIEWSRTYSVRRDDAIIVHGKWIRYIAKECERDRPLDLTGGRCAVPGE